MDVSKIIELVNALDDTWIGGLFSPFYVIALLLCAFILFLCFYFATKCLLNYKIALFYDYYIETEFSDYIDKERSLPWYKRLYIWFLRH